MLWQSLCYEKLENEMEQKSWICWGKVLNLLYLRGKTLACINNWVFMNFLHAQIHLNIKCHFIASTSSAPIFPEIFCEIMCAIRSAKKALSRECDLTFKSYVRKEKCSRIDFTQRFYIVFFLSFLYRHTYWMFFAMYSEHFRCDIVHSFDMGRWNCWRHLRFRYRFNMLLCGEYEF